ncbi:ParB N-terminal domain-containing protein [Euzebya sp.]|uniref:ParB N-terminal domain-containing protein n=1 Tax=Euzebya sp. TaxID=1971409 RepID=UPI003515DEA0
MTASSGFIELDRAVESIRVGRRHRHDLGDLSTLVASIGQVGLLQPITISPDGTLICGARRLAAAKQLGLKRVNVWVRSGVSSPLEQLLAEQHENTLRKPYSPREAAALYRELKALIGEDNARRQEASRFGGDGDPYGGANLAPPSDRKSRAQAAQLVTGRKSYTTLERIGELERLAADDDIPEDLRALAAEELDGIETDGKVYGHYQRVIAARDHTPPPTDDVDDDAEEAAEPEPPPPPNQPTAHAATAAPPRQRTRGVRSFLLTWNAMDGWADRYDPDHIGPALTTDQWATFETTVTATVAFLHTARKARAATEY